MNKTQKRLNKKQKQMIDLLKLNGCNVSQACKQVGISRQTHYNWLDEFDTYKKAYNETDEALLDFVESALIKNIKEGNVTAQIFYLKTKGKDRGYTERIEHKIDEDAGIDIVVHTQSKEE